VVRVDTSPATVTPAAAALPAVPRARARTRTEESGQAGRRRAQGGRVARPAGGTWWTESQARDVRGYEPRCRRCRVSMLACVPGCRVPVCVLADWD